MTTTQPFEDETSLLDRGKLTKTSFILPPGLAYDEWAEMAHPLISIAQAAMWWVGDWLLYGEHEYGEKYAQAITATGYALSTLKNAQWVSDRFPPDERREDVTHSGHRAIAGLDPKPRAELLVRAAEEHMSEGELRGRVKVLQGKVSATETSRSTQVEVIEPDPPATEAEAVDRAILVLDQAAVREDWSLVKQATEILRTGVTLR